MTYAIETSGLTKSYQKTLCVNHIHLKVPFQSIYGFLGPNGAGKSTLMKVLTGVYTKDTGTILIGGEEIRKNNPVVAKNLGIARYISS